MCLGIGLGDGCVVENVGVGDGTLAQIAAEVATAPPSNCGIDVASTPSTRAVTATTHSTAEAIGFHLTQSIIPLSTPPFPGSFALVDCGGIKGKFNPLSDFNA